MGECELNLAEKLKECRTREGLTQVQIAERLSVSRKTVSSWENGRSIPDIQTLLELSDLYQLSVDELIRDEQVLADCMAQSKNEARRKRLTQGSYWLVGILWPLGFVEYVKPGGVHSALINLAMIICTTIFLFNFTDWQRFSKRSYLITALAVFLVLFGSHLLIGIVDPNFISRMINHSPAFLTGNAFGMFTLVFKMSLLLEIILFCQPKRPLFGRKKT